MAIVKAGTNYLKESSQYSPTCFQSITLNSGTGDLILNDPPLAIYVGTAGNLKVVGSDGITALVPVRVGENRLSPSIIIDDADTTARDVVLGFYQKNQVVVPVNTIAPFLFVDLPNGYNFIANSGTWESPSPLSYFYEFFLDGKKVTQNTTGIYEGSINDRDKVVTCKVLAINTDGGASIFTNEVIVNSVGPQVLFAPSANSSNGDELPSTFGGVNGTWTGVDVDTVYTYQWYRGLVAIDGATGSGTSDTINVENHLAVSPADLGQTVYLGITATTTAGSNFITSTQKITMEDIAP